MPSQGVFFSQLSKHYCQRVLRSTEVLVFNLKQQHLRTFAKLKFFVSWFVASGFLFDDLKSFIICKKYSSCIGQTIVIIDQMVFNTTMLDL